MLDSIQSLLDTLPEGVVQIRGGLVQACSGKARQYLPQLAVGEPVPNQLALSGEDGGGVGEFSREGAVYSYSCSAAGDELLVLIRPVSDGVLTGRQLEGVAYQLRTLLGDMLAEVGPSTAEEGGPVPAAAFGKTFHRLFRRPRFSGRRASRWSTAVRRAVCSSPVTRRCWRNCCWS